MADNLGALVVRIAADIKELEAGLNQAAGSTRSATSNMQSSLDSLEKKAISVAKGLAALWSVDQAAEAVKQTTLLAARYETLGLAMVQVGKNQGYSADQMNAYAAAMQKAGISMVESRSTLTQMAQAHINLADAEKLARVAQDAAVIGNINSSEAFARMIHGIQAGQVEILRTIGIQVNFESAYKKTADQLKINVDWLTENEKSQARANAVMQRGTDIAGSYEVAMSTAGKQLNSMTRYWEDLKVKIGNAFLETFTNSIFGQVDALKKLGAEMDKLAASGQIEAWGHSLAQTVGTGTNALKDSVSWLWKHRDAVEAIAGVYATVKIASWLGPVITQTAAATASAVEYYTALATGRVVELGSAQAAAQRAAASLVTATADVQATGATVALTAARVAEVRASVLAAEGAVQLAIVENGLVPAQAKATAAAAAHASALAAQAAAQTAAATTAEAAKLSTMALGAGVTALGGPIGIIITVLGLAATAWAVFGRTGKSAVDEINGEIEKGIAIAQRYKKEAQFGTGDVGQLNASLDAVNKRIEVLSRSQGQGAADLLAKARAEADTLTTALRKAEGGVTAVGKAATESSGRLAKMAEQYKPKEKLSDVLGQLEREYAEEQRLAGGNAAKLLEVKNLYETAKLGITKKFAEQDKKLTDAWADGVAKSYTSAMDGLGKLQVAETAKANDLGKAQTKLLEVMSAPEWKGYSFRMQEEIILAASLAQGEEDRANALTSTKKATEELAKAEEASNKAMVGSYEEVLKQAKAEEERAAKIGLTAQQLGVLRLAEIDVLITQQEVAAQTPEIDDARLKGIEMQIAALKRLRAAAKGAIDSQATADLAKEANDSWQKTSEQIGQSLTDQIMAGGKNGFEYLKSLARTTILQPVVKALVSPISAVAASFMGTAGTAAAGGMAGTAGTGFLGGLGATAGGWGTGIANGLSAWGAEGSVSGMMANASLYSTAEIVGALAPIGLGIMALVAISKATAGEMRSGGQYAYNPITGTQFAQGPSGGQINGAEVTTAISGTVETINRLLKSFGSGSQLARFVAGLESSGDNRGGVMAGGTLSTGGMFGQSGQGSVYDGTMYDPSKSFNLTAQEAATAFALELQQSVIKAMQASDLPAYLQKVFTSLNANTMTADQITNTLAFAASLKEVRSALLETRDPLQILRDNVALGFAELHTSASAFKTDFVAAIDAGITPANLATWQALGSNMDQLAQATGTADTAVKALGRSLADIANERTRLQDQYDQLTMSATELLTKQRNAIDASNQSLFDQVQTAQAAKTATDALAQSQKDAAAAAEALATVNQGWQDQLDILTGAQTDRSIALRDATDESTRALMRQVYQQQDLKTASTAAADALAAVTSNAKALRDTAMSATNDALAAVERSIAAQRKIEDAAVAAAQKQVDAVTSVFDVLQTQVKELQPMSAAAGNRWLDAALASGGTSDKQGLSDAIAAARSGLSNNNFSSAVDAQRATSLLANKLASLSNLTGAKLTDAQQQLKTATDAVAALDALLQTSRDQVTDAREGTLSIVDAISELQTALVTELQALQTSFGDSLVTGFSSIDTSANSQISLAEFKAQFAGLASNATLEQVFGALDTDGSGLLSRLEAIRGSSFTTAQALELMRISAAGGLMGPAKTYTMAEMVAALQVAMSTGASAGAVVNAANVNYGILPADVASVAAITGNTAVQAAAVAAQATRHAVGGALGGARDYTMSELENALTVVITQQHYDVATAILGAWQNWGIYEADVRAAGKAAGLPGFAQGTNYVVADMQAQIHEGERIMPRADNELLMQRLQSPQTNNQVLVAAIRAMQDETKALRQEVAKLRAENSAENRAIAISSAQTASALDDSKAGGRWINVKVVTP